MMTCRKNKNIFIVISTIVVFFTYQFILAKLVLSDQTVSDDINNDLMLDKSEVTQNMPEGKPTLKYILQWTSPKTIPFVYMGNEQEEFIKLNCPYTNCIVTANRSYLSDYSKFDVIAFAGPEVIFYGTELLPEQRSSHQKYAFASIESSDNYPICSKTFNSYFNWTWTYKLDSDVRWGYFYIKDKNNEIVGPKKEMHWIKLEDMDPVSDDFKQQLETKTKAAAWFVSNCYSKSKREQVFEELKEELDNYYNMVIDVYGQCGNLTCSQQYEDDCDKLIKNNYYFYLSFENSFSEDYVTEKLLRALNNDAVPIVFGGANYTRFMPDGIYIDANKLTIREIAAKMYELINDPEKYATYFKWKNHYSYHKQQESVETNPYCLFCTILNNEEMVKKTTIYEDFREWWSGDVIDLSVCKILQKGNSHERSIEQKYNEMTNIS